MIAIRERMGVRAATGIRLSAAISADWQRGGCGPFPGGSLTPCCHLTPRPSRSWRSSSIYRWRFRFPGEKAVMPFEAKTDSWREGWQFSAISWRPASGAE